MIGEIRDLETAQIAMQASLTGHLVLATLHTNDAPSAVTRLIDMGVEPFLLSSSLLGVLAQRLVRKLCVHLQARWTTQATDTRSAATLRPHRLPGPHRRLRVAGDQRRHPRADPQPRLRGRHPQAAAWQRA